MSSLVCFSGGPADGITQSSHYKEKALPSTMWPKDVKMIAGGLYMKDPNAKEPDGAVRYVWKTVQSKR